MIRLIAALWLASASAGLAQTAVQEGVPSGQPLVLWEIRWERVAGQEGVQMILRALAPEAKARGYAAAEADMGYLCQTHGAPLAVLPHAGASHIVVNLADRPVPRGTTDPEATQFFGLYQLQDGRCISENF